jgi:hypothetical protein
MAAKKGISDDKIRQVYAQTGGAVRAAAQALGVRPSMISRRFKELGLSTNEPGHNEGHGGVSFEGAIQQTGRRHTSIQDGHIIVFSDAHYWPGIITPAHRALLYLCRELQPKVVVCNGDAFDGATVSRFARIGWDNRPKLLDELRACEARLEDVRRAAPSAQRYWPLGNHDARFENILAARVPEFEGVDGFHLKDRFPEWTPCWGLWVNHDVVIKHRFKGGIHAVRNNALTGGKTFVTGHLHSLKVVPITDYGGTRWGVDTGTLADPEGPQFFDYTEDNPKDWRQGFVVLTFHRGRLLWPRIVHIINDDTADFNGTLLNI